jgi:glycosyltransferase involved in cell wall biosynthesis
MKCDRRDDHVELAPRTALSAGQIVTDRLKVLFITNWYPTREEPAKAVWAREHAKAVRIYDDVVVLHCVGSDCDLKSCWTMIPESDPGLSYGIPTYRLWYCRSRIPHASYLVYLWSIWGAFRRLVDQGFRPDVIHVHVYDAGWPAVLIGTLHHIPVVVSEHFSSFPRRLLAHLDLAKAWLAFRWASSVLTVSHALQEAIERYGLRARFQVVPNVVDTTLFSPCAQRRADADPKRLLVVGQLEPVKGVPYLLQALSALRKRRDDWHLDIVGDGDRRMEYEQLAADLELCDKVTFHGLKPKSEVAEFMRRADLLVLPSLFETFSAPAAEALATGTPVLATRCGGPEEFVVDNVGVLVSPGDVDALRLGLDSMLDRLQRYSRREISQYARERFSLEVVGAQLHAVYQAVRADGQASRKARTTSSSRTRS